MRTYRGSQAVQEGLWHHVKFNDVHASVQELERGLDTMLDAYGNNAGQEHEDVQGPSAPHPAASKKKPQRPSKKPRGASSSQGSDLVLMYSSCSALSYRSKSLFACVSMVMALSPLLHVQALLCLLQIHRAAWLLPQQ